MAFIPVEDCVRVLFSGLTQGYSWQTSIYLHDPQPGVPSELENIAAAALSWFQETLTGNWSAATSLASVTVTDESAKDGLRYDETPIPPIAGTVVQENLPTQCAAVVTFLTGLRGRSRRGRVYIPGMTIADVVGSQIGGAMISQLEGAFTTLNNAFTPYGAYHVVVSRYSDNQPRPAGIKTRVQGYRINPVVCTQRRRMIGVGA